MCPSVRMKYISYTLRGGIVSRSHDVFISHVDTHYLGSDCYTTVFSEAANIAYHRRCNTYTYTYVSFAGIYCDVASECTPGKSSCLSCSRWLNECGLGLGLFLFSSVIFSHSGVQHMLGGNIPMGKLFLEPYSMTKWHVMIR